MALFKKNNKINPRNMSQEELETYVKNLPETRPPKLSSAAWCGGTGVAFILMFIWRLRQHGFESSWVLLAAGVLLLIGAGWLVYKILTFGKND